jgi:sulfite reductase alpha subunit-like flavoprotein
MWPLLCRPTNLGTQSLDNSFIKKLKSSGRSLVVFYGSQTGTAEEFAGRLAKEGIRYRLKGMVADPEECDMVRRITEYVHIYLLSEIGYFTQKTSYSADK